MLGTMADFSLGNISNNPNFDFLQTLLKEKDEADNLPNFSFADSPYDSTNISCNYMCENEFISTFANNTKPSVLSINVQSLPAKFNDLCEFINSLKVSNCAPDIICLQEIWKLPNDDFFNIEGFHPLVYKSRSNSVQGGGVGIFVSNKLSFSVNDELSIFVDRILESIFVDVSINAKKFTIGSLYRPGTTHTNLSANEQFSQFIELFSSISECATSKPYPFYIFGDTNIDCLKYNSSPNSTEFIDLLFSHGLLQIVTKLDVHLTQRLLLIILLPIMSLINLNQLFLFLIFLIIFQFSVLSILRKLLLSLLTPSQEISQSLIFRILIIPFLQWGG